MSQIGLTRIILSPKGERLVTFEQAARLTHTSVTIVEQFVALGIIEPVESMLRLEDLDRIIRVFRLRRDLGLNLVGASMVLDMAQEIAELRSQIRTLRQQLEL